MLACRLNAGMIKRNEPWPLPGARRFNDGKLEASEELGDLVSGAGDKDMALSLYQQCGANGKVRHVAKLSCKRTCLLCSSVYHVRFVPKS